MATSCRILFVGCLTLASGIYAQSPGRLTGRVVADNTGNPIEGITVIAVQKVATGRPATLHAPTATDGTYVIDGALAGSYGLCVHAWAPYLDPCDWGASVVTSAGGPPQEIRLRLGVPVVVRLVDPSGHAAGRDKERPPPLAVTLAGAVGAERPVPVTNRGAGGEYEFSYLAPAGMALKLKVASNELLLADASGAPIDEHGHTFAVTTPSTVAKPLNRRRIPVPFSAPGFGPPSVVVAVKARGKK